MSFEGEIALEGVGHVLPLLTPTLPPATHTNACLLGAGGESIVVEPATPHEDERARLLAWVLHHQERGARITAIALTHHHIDHVGAADWLRAELGVPLLAHGLTKSRLAGQIEIDRTLEDGEVLALCGGARSLSLEVLHTPGHAPGHVCFWEPSTRTLIAGDMVAGSGTILIEPTDGDIGLYLASLARLAALEPRAIVPAHGGILQKEVLLRTIAHRRAREAKILGALRLLGGERGIDEILPVAYADTPVAAWPLARLQTEAHLIELAKSGAVACAVDGWLATPAD